MTRITDAGDDIGPDSVISVTAMKLHKNGNMVPSLGGVIYATAANSKLVAAPRARWYVPAVLSQHDARGLFGTTIGLIGVMFLFGLYLICSGVLLLLAALKTFETRESFWAALAYGLLMLAVALWLFFSSGATFTLLVLLTAANAFGSGILEIVLAHAVRRDVDALPLSAAGVLSLFAWFGLILDETPKSPGWSLPLAFMQSFMKRFWLSFRCGCTTSAGTYISLKQSELHQSLNTTKVPRHNPRPACTVKGDLRTDWLFRHGICDLRHIPMFGFRLRLFLI